MTKATKLAIVIVITIALAGLAAFNHVKWTPAPIEVFAEGPPEWPTASPPEGWVVIEYLKCPRFCSV